MAHVTPDGWLEPDPGDFLRVERLPRATDYGPLLTADGLPDVLCWHLTGANIPLGADDADHDGSRGMAKRVASGSARFYAHGFLSRDATFFQNVPFTRSAIHVAGKWQGRETNRIASGVEIVNAGWCRLDGIAPGFKVDTNRPDWVRAGNLFWQTFTFRQNSAILELGEAWRRWTGRAPEDCVRGHHDLDPGSTHADPGAVGHPFLHGPLLAHLQAMTL